MDAALRIRGRIQRGERYVYAICDEAGVAMHGATEEEALGRLRTALGMYFGALCEDGQLEAAIKAGKLNIEIPADSQPSRNAVYIKREDDTFTATVSGSG